MKRKVVKQGSSTLMVSLPSDWAKRYRITKGDELDMQEQGRSLLVTTHKDFSISSTSVDVDDLEPMIMRTFAALYKAGYDELKVTFSDAAYGNPKNVVAIQNALRHEISSFEIVEQGKNHCLVKNIEGTLEEGFEPILRRTFMLLITMAEDSLVAIKGNDLEDLNRLKALEESNNRLTTFCRRLLSKQGYRDHKKIQFIYHIIEELEHIADQYKYLFDYLLQPENKRLKLTKETLQYYEQTNKMLRMYYDLFYKFDKKTLVALARLRKSLMDDVNRRIERARRKDAIVLHYLVLQVQTIFEMVEPYLSMVL
ncbi:TPA: phosphate uptake regulator PhoU [Candidatus Woesearchaeota archaeon]|nr:phosphate uptake regulator PhoU [Candidatus Woesearchaeota archaeon]